MSDDEIAALLNSVTLKLKSDDKLAYDSWSESVAWASDQYCPAKLYKNLRKNPSNQGLYIIA